MPKILRPAALTCSARLLRRALTFQLPQKLSSRACLPQAGEAEARLLQAGTYFSLRPSVPSVLSVVKSSAY